MHHDQPPTGRSFTATGDRSGLSWVHDSSTGRGTSTEAFIHDLHDLIVVFKYTIREKMLKMWAPPMCKYRHLLCGCHSAQKTADEAN